MVCLSCILAPLDSSNSTILKWPFPHAINRELKPLVENIGDATLVVPMIKEYLEVGVKNDEHLIKMLAIVQRMEGGNKGGESDFFNPEELAKLMEQSEEIGKTLNKEEE